MTSQDMFTDKTPPFRPMKKLGQGSFGETWRVELLSEGLILAADGVRTAAAKFPVNEVAEHGLQKELELNGVLVQRCSDADRAHIVRYYGQAAFGNHLVMIMEFMPDGNLRQLIHKHADRRPPLDLCLNLVLDVLHGVSVMHQQQIVHRDIKPENILIAGDRAKVGDLGLGRTIYRNMDGSISHVGAFPYAAPEIYLFRPRYEFGVDVWSIGVMLYEMLAGQRPFRAATEEGLKHCIVNEVEVPLHTIPGLVPEIPVAISEVVAQALQKDPKDRYQTAAEMREDLMEAADPNKGLAVAIAKIDALTKAKRSFHETDREVRQMLRRYEGLAGSFHQAAVAYLRYEQWEKAFDAAERGLVRFDADPNLHQDAAHALANLKRLAEAVTCMKRAIDLGLSGRDLASARRRIELWSANSTPAEEG